MGIIVQDTFTETSDTALDSHIPDTGDGWTEEEKTGAVYYKVDGANDWLVATGYESSDEIIYSAQPNPSSVDYDIEITCLTQKADSDDDPFWLIARFVDTNNYYGAGAYPLISTADKRIYKKVTGTPTELASGDTGNDPGDVLKFEVRNATKKLYLNDDEILSTGDNVLSDAGKAGLAQGECFISNEDISSQWTFDGLSITEVEASVEVVAEPLISPGILGGILAVLMAAQAFSAQGSLSAFPTKIITAQAFSAQGTLTAKTKISIIPGILSAQNSLSANLQPAILAPNLTVAGSLSGFPTVAIPAQTMSAAGALSAKTKVSMIASTLSAQGEFSDLPVSPGEIVIAELFSLEGTLSANLQQAIPIQAFSVIESLSANLQPGILAESFSLEGILAGVPLFQLTIPALSLQESISAQVKAGLVAQKFFSQSRLGGELILNLVINEQDLALYDVIYECILTGKQNGLSDLVLPISSFQGNVRRVLNQVAYTETSSVDDTSYANAGGTGDRTAIITVSSPTIIGTLSDLVNGNIGDQAARFRANTVILPGSDFIQFDFGAPKLITEVKFWAQSTGIHFGMWKWQGLNDDGEWQDISPDFLLGEMAFPALFPQLHHLSNETPYESYRIVTAGGGSVDVGWMSEFDFKIAPITTTGAGGDWYSDNFYVSVIVPGTDLTTEIANRPNGFIKLKRGLRSTISGQELLDERIFRVPFEAVSIEHGARSRAIKLEGRKESPNEDGNTDPQTYDLFVEYYSEALTERVRCALNGKILLGDSGTFRNEDGDTITIEDIEQIQYIDPYRMELTGILT